MPILMPKPHCLNYCSFVMGFEIRKCESFNFVLFQDSCGDLGSLKFYLVMECHFAPMFEAFFLCAGLSQGPCWESLLLA